MTENKNLIVTKQGNTYCGENNAEIIKIILPKILNGIDLSETKTYLHYLNRQNYGDKFLISDTFSEYNNDYYAVELPLSEKLTAVSGNVQMWVTVYYTSSDDEGESMLAKTNMVNCNIKPHVNVEDEVGDDVIYF